MLEQRSGGPGSLSAEPREVCPSESEPLTTPGAAAAREQLIRDALAARKSREAEWDALTPEQKNRAIAGLGDSMAAIVKAFRTA